MPLTPGSSVGPYKIIEKAGAGGMGEVFKAKDTRLDRTVAIKVLPHMVAANEELKQRFEREAKTISSLNHPNICTLYDVGHEEGLDYLVMEFLEGETLYDRVKRGPVPLDELLKIAGQIADALDKAHVQGLVHRDLKPANVMLTPTGAKLLDFGLAKLQVADGHVEGISNITQTTPLTGAGTILGTIQYMAPEQLEGKEADARSDIFALGALLYEMATGRPAFDGQSQAGLIAGILERQPTSLTGLNPNVPPAFERLVDKCLNKNPEKRWQSARDLADELRWIERSGSQIGMPAHVAARRKLNFRMAWVMSALLGIAAVAFAVLWFTREIPETKLMRFKITTRTDISQVSWPCISPDGKLLAFSAMGTDGQDRIWIRPINSLDSYALQGTEGANRPFWSPDSKYIAFVVDREQLKKIPAAGGPVQLICETIRGADGTWGAAGQIIYDAGNGDSLFMVSASGGTPSPLPGIDTAVGEQTHSWPWFLPDGKQYLYLASINDPVAAGGNHMLRVGNIETRESKALFPVDARVQYCEPGYLVYFRDGILLAQRFDPDNLEVIGEARPITDDVGVGEADRAEFGVSDDGMLVYQTNASASLNKIVWVDRTGAEVGQIGEPGAYDDIFLSPDETRLAITTFDGSQADIWVYDLERDVKTRITFDERPDITPLWSHDNKYVYHSNNRSGRFAVYRKAANGLGEAELMKRDDSVHMAVATRSSDGRYLYGPRVMGNYDIVRFDTRDSFAIKTIVATPFAERAAAVSPDGNYLAYYSDESGQSEIYVLELAEGGGRWQITSDGAQYPMWSADGSELYYLSQTWDFTMVPVSTKGRFTVGKPTRLFNKILSTDGLGRNRYIVTKDPNRFIFNTPLTAAGGGEFTAVVNWQKELEVR